MSENSDIVVNETGELLPATFNMQSDIRNELQVQSSDLERMGQHLELMKKFVGQHLTEGKDGEGDYGTITGMKKKVLFKPGAEKLMRLFGLGCRLKLTDKEFDRHDNFASFTYQAEIYHLRTGTVLGQCEANANSWEKKYKEKAVWKNGQKSGTEPIPVSDILNTLQKMAQKRAIVGVVMMTTTASEFFTQDEDQIEAQKPIRKNTVIENKFVEAKVVSPNEYIIPFGVLKGRKFSDLDRDALVNYCQNLKLENPKMNDEMNLFLENARQWMKMNPAPQKPNGPIETKAKENVKSSPSFRLE